MFFFEGVLVSVDEETGGGARPAGFGTAGTTIVMALVAMLLLRKEAKRVVKKSTTKYSVHTPAKDLENKMEWIGVQSEKWGGDGGEKGKRK